MSVIIIKNSGSVGIEISDLGISIPAFGERELVGPNGLFSKIDIFESLDLKVLVQSGVLVMNDGFEDLSKEDGFAFVQVESRYEDIADDSSSGSINPDKYLSTIATEFIFSNEGNLLVKNI